MHSDFIRCSSNVHIKAFEKGALKDERKGHNVFVNQGRQWLRNLVGSKLYDIASPNASLAAHDGGNTGRDIYSVVDATYRIRYIGVGIGGTKQNVTPPGPGAQSEVVTVTELESPVLTDASTWYQEVVAQDDINDVEVFPADGYTIRFRAVFSELDISFLGQLGGYGTNVPISEIVLATSEVDPAGSGQANVGQAPGSVGVVAYHTLTPIQKTPNMVLELDWSLTF